MKASDVLSQANCGIVGIDESLSVFGGYDERFEQAGAAAQIPEWVEAENWNAMSADEKVALADAMITRWQRYKKEAASIKGGEPDASKLDSNAVVVLNDFRGATADEIDRLKRAAAFLER